MYEQDSSYRKYIVQCSLEYPIRGDVVVIATVVDVVIIKGCRISVRAVVAYVVEYFVDSIVTLPCKYYCNIFL